MVIILCLHPAEKIISYSHNIIGTIRRTPSSFTIQINTNNSESSLQLAVPEPELKCKM